MIKLAMIGASGYAYELLKRISTIPETIEIVGVSNDPAEKCIGTTFCREKGIPLYDRVDPLLEQVQGKARVVYVPPPIHTHFGLAKQCLEAGFAVWLEKPPVATIQDLDALIELSRTHGKKIPVGFQYLYSTILQVLNETFKNLE